MSLADRLAAASATRRVRAGAGGEAPVAAAPPRPAGGVDPFGDLKRTVHQTLLDNLGPKLYDSRLTQPTSSRRSGRPCRRCWPGTRRR